MECVLSKLKIQNCSPNGFLMNYDIKLKHMNDGSEPAEYIYIFT